MTLRPMLLGYVHTLRLVHLPWLFGLPLCELNMEVTVALRVPLAQHLQRLAPGHPKPNMEIHALPNSAPIALRLTLLHGLDMASPGRQRFTEASGTSEPYEQPYINTSTICQTASKPAQCKREKSPKPPRKTHTQRASCTPPQREETKHGTHHIVVASTNETCTVGSNKKIWLDLRAPPDAYVLRGVCFQ